jgi:hypothetical protein
MVEGSVSLTGGFGVRVAFLLVMVAIGSYVIGKGQGVAGDVQVIGVLLLPVGLLTLVYAFVLSRSYLMAGGGETVALVRALFLLGILLLGGWLTGRAVGLIRRPRLTGLVLAPVGVGGLVVVFLTANRFVSGAIDLGPVPIKLAFFVYMLALGFYLTGRGVVGLSGDR